MLFSDDTVDIVDERDGFQLTGAESEIVNLCNKIRKIALTGNIQIDGSKHRHSDNKHLFPFIEMCGFTVKSFITSYLSSIQPYMIIRDSSQDFFDKDVKCIVDISYKVPLYIKINFKQHNEFVISFHEDQNRHRYKNIGKSTNKYSVLISDIFSEHLPADHVFEEFKVTISKGFIKLNITSRGVLVKSNNVYKVYTQDLNDEINRSYNNVLKSIFNTDTYDLLTTTKLDNITFTSYGEHKLNKISILIDAIASNKYIIEKNFLLSELNHLLHELTQYTNHKEYYIALKNRYHYMLHDKNIKDSYKNTLHSLFHNIDCYLEVENDV